MQASSLSSHVDRIGETLTSWLNQDEIPKWYYGDISREAAENLLQKKPLGCFLVRASQRHVGYTLSYRAKDCCRHFMIKLLLNGCLVVPGEKDVHPTLVDLENENSEDTSLYSNMAVDEKTGAVDSSSSYKPKSSPSLPYTVSPKPISLPQKRMTEMPQTDRPNSSQTWMKPSEQSPAPGHAQRAEKTSLNDVPQKIWENLKTGKKITEQIKSHLPNVKILFPSSPKHVKNQARGASDLVGDESATQMEYSYPEREDKNSPNIYTDPFERDPLPEHSFHSESQELCLPLRKSVGTSISPISASKEVIFPGPRRGVILETTYQGSPKSAGDNLYSFSEEYHPPPPFAPGF
ncbi:hematopoietic SH2 domain-containing protein isoform X2 [Macrotis lagotis]|uniref:hematopoietic SH2 domain-containing protein isoform X2 n=1 Tax=Macrotis lagotis TaxID=92651 RepID=UPI003D69B235